MVRRERGARREQGCARPQNELRCSAPGASNDRRRFLELERSDVGAGDLQPRAVAQQHVCCWNTDSSCGGGCATAAESPHPSLPPPLPPCSLSPLPPSGRPCPRLLPPPAPPTPRCRRPGGRCTGSAWPGARPTSRPAAGGGNVIECSRPVMVWSVYHCEVRDANMGHQLAGGNRGWCPELESRTAPRSCRTMGVQQSPTMRCAWSNCLLQAAWASLLHMTLAASFSAFRFL